MQQPQLTNRIFMVRPANFGFNSETSASNSFQENDLTCDPEKIKHRAAVEFNLVVSTLRREGINVLVIDDSPSPVKTDAIFPNNWITLHTNGTIVTYPMFSESRRFEIREEILSEFDQRFQVREIWRLEKEAKQGQFLEGTGSMVLDRDQRIAYACRSGRTNETLLSGFCDRMHYCPVLFDAADENGVPIYHTNVIMAVCTDFVVICLESIADLTQRNVLMKKIILSGKDILDISFGQVKQFAGNMLQLDREAAKPLVVMSAKAKSALTAEQLRFIKRDSDIVALEIPTIEKYGGGSVRCMLAEIFLQPKK